MHKRCFLLLFLMGFVLLPLAAITYSAFSPELTYTPYGSILMDNYTNPEQMTPPPAKDSIEWDIPVRNWDSFWRFNRSLWSDYRDNNAIFQYRFRNDKLDFYNRSNFLLGYDGTFFPGEQYNFFYIGFNQQAVLGPHWHFHSQFAYCSLRGDSCASGRVL